LGKFFFDKPQWIQEPKLRAGLHVEKGLGAEYAALFKKKAFELGPRWTWHRLLKDMLDGPVALAFQEISSKLPGAVQIEVRSSATPPEHAVTEKPARALMKWRPDQTLETRLLSEGKNQQLRGLADIADLPSLAKALKRTESFPAHWVDLFIYTEFACGSGSTGQPHEYQPSQVWSDLLEPLARWVG